MKEERESLFFRSKISYFLVCCKFPTTPSASHLEFPYSSKMGIGKQDSLPQKRATEMQSICSCEIDVRLTWTTQELNKQVVITVTQHRKATSDRKL